METSREGRGVGDPQKSAAARYPKGRTTSSICARPRRGAVLASRPPVRGWPRRFHERYRGVLPLNCPDELPEEETQEQQVVTELLAIAQGCGYDGRPAYRLPISFPRFAAAFAALYVWRPDDGQLPAKQNSKIARMVKQAIAEERRYTLQEMKERAEALARDEQVAQRLGGLVGVMVKVADVCRFPHRRTVRWYRRKWFRGRVVTQRRTARSPSAASEAECSTPTWALVGPNGRPPQRNCWASCRACWASPVISCRPIASDSPPCCARNWCDRASDAGPCSSCWTTRPTTPRSPPVSRRGHAPPPRHLTHAP
ncbi:hypothetical protein SAZ11_27650 [Streptomyces sp. FXJ1.4098]|nr:hypothetical protein [Streptomyces sp. FXJ1.4098]